MLYICAPEKNYSLCHLKLYYEFDNKTLIFFNSFVKELSRVKQTQMLSVQKHCSQYLQFQTDTENRVFLEVNNNSKRLLCLEVFKIFSVPTNKAL